MKLITFILSLILIIVSCSSNDSQQMHFEEIFDKWLEQSAERKFSPRSNIHPMNDNESYREMMSLSRKHLPYLIDKMRSDPE